MINDEIIRAIKLVDSLELLQHSEVEIKIKWDSKIYCWQVETVETDEEFIVKSSGIQALDDAIRSVIMARLSRVDP